MEQFNCETKKIGGKTVFVIKAKTETIIRKDGTQDVIVHAPSLKMIADFFKNKEVENGIGDIQ